MPFACPRGMAYLPRYEIICDNAHFHVTWQCHNKDWLMQWGWAKRAYYDLLLKYKDKYAIEVYSYNFMDNHPHLTGHLESKEQFSAFFRVVNSQFARIVNKQLNRRGQVVMERFKSPLIGRLSRMTTFLRETRKVSASRSEWLCPAKVQKLSLRLF